MQTRRFSHAITPKIFLKKLPSPWPSLQDFISSFPFIKYCRESAGKFRVSFRITGFPVFIANPAIPECRLIRTATEWPSPTKQDALRSPVNLSARKRAPVWLPVLLRHCERNSASGLGSSPKFRRKWRVVNREPRAEEAMSEHSLARASLPWKKTN